MHIQSGDGNASKWIRDYNADGDYLRERGSIRVDGTSPNWSHLFLRDHFTAEPAGSAQTEIPKAPHIRADRNDNADNRGVIGRARRLRWIQQQRTGEPRHRVG